MFNYPITCSIGNLTFVVTFELPGENGSPIMFIPDKYKLYLRKIFKQSFLFFSFFNSHLHNKYVDKILLSCDFRLSWWISRGGDIVGEAIDFSLIDEAYSSFSILFAQQVPLLYCQTTNKSEKGMLTYQSFTKIAMGLVGLNPAQLSYFAKSLDKDT